MWRRIILALTGGITSIGGPQAERGVVERRVGRERGIRGAIGRRHRGAIAHPPGGAVEAAAARHGRHVRRVTGESIPSTNGLCT